LQVLKDLLWGIKAGRVSRLGGWGTKEGQGKSRRNRTTFLLPSLLFGGYRQHQEEELISFPGQASKEILSGGRGRNNVVRSFHSQ
jgi:hypothetical protein